MRLLLLAMVAGVFPFGWGWVVHSLVARLWPAPSTKATECAEGPMAPMPIDYQI